MVPSGFKLISYITIAIIAFGILGSTDASNANIPQQWDFDNNCFLNFSPQPSFLEAPSHNLPCSDYLTGYWNLNEGLGTNIYDSIDGSSSIIHGSTWTEGIYGTALFFDGIDDYVDVHVTAPGSNPIEFTVSFWMYPQAWGGDYYRTIVDKDWGTIGGLTIYLDKGTHKLYFATKDSSSTCLAGSTISSLNTWYFVTCVFHEGTPNKIYVNGLKGSDSSRIPDESIDLSSSPIHFSQNSGDFHGILDEFKIFNRALNQKEIASLYYLCNSDSFLNYYSFVDSSTNNVMLISLNCTGQTDNVLVTCDNFFTNDRLIFHANGTVSLNVWTNLGEPAFSTGLWHPHNNTTTFTLDSLSVSEINWVLSPSPKAESSKETENIANPFVSELLVIGIVCLLIVSFLIIAIKKGAITIERLEKNNVAVSSNSFKEKYLYKKLVIILNGYWRTLS